MVAADNCLKASEVKQVLAKREESLEVVCSISRPRGHPASLRSLAEGKQSSSDAGSTACVQR